ncbi:hypothetical protein BOX15_Mlig032566g2 [Macrostomum lignano]|uniref:Glycoside hydrolase family 65 central catalytic domain-containing protein n=1 Tax=Macrostomum lignano TaxID=282301 RepID=A0A267H1M9_9PLAT|nr:hypothetical protein BOX15_Mlig032566g2 [Macrostomum lignano]
MRPVRWNRQRLVRLALAALASLLLAAWLCYALLSSEAADSVAAKRYLTGYNAEGLVQDVYNFPDLASGQRRFRPRQPTPATTPTSMPTLAAAAARPRTPAPTRRYGVLKPTSRPRPTRPPPDLFAARIPPGGQMYAVPDVPGRHIGQLVDDGRHAELLAWAERLFADCGGSLRSVPAPSGVALTAATAPPLANGLIGHRPFVERHMFVDGAFTATGYRLRVPQLAYRNISLVSTPADGRLRRRLDFLAPFGQLVQTIATADSVVEQRIYAHALLPTVLVHEVDILRKLGHVDLTTGFTVTFEREWSMPDGVEVTQLTLRNETLRRRLGQNARVLQISTPELSTRRGARVYVVFDQLSQDLEAPRGKHRSRATFLQSSAPNLGDALAGYLAARRLTKAPAVSGGAGSLSDRLGEAHLSAWRAVWLESGLLADEGIGGHLCRRLLAAQQQLLSSLPLYRRLTPPAALRSGRLPAYSGLAFNGLSDEAARVTFDQDLWSVSYLALTAPAMAAELLAGRAAQLPGAMARANRTGWSGARYCAEPLLQAAAPGGQCHPKPLLHSDPERDDHVTGDVAIGAAAYLMATGRRADRLASLGRRIVQEAARYYASRTVDSGLLSAGSGKDRRRRRKLVGTAFSVGVAKRTLVLPELLGGGGGNNATSSLAKLSRQLRLPQQRDGGDDSSGDGVFHPDVAPIVGGAVRFGPAMLPFPVGLALPRPALRRDLLAYAGALLAAGGADPPVPLLAATAVAWLRLGQPKRAWAALRAALPACSGPAGCTQQATGGPAPAPHNAAPLLSAALFGYAGARLTGPNGLVLGPCALPPGVGRLRLFGLHFHGNRLALEVSDGSLTVRLAGWSAHRPDKLSVADSLASRPLQKIGALVRTACDSELRIVAEPVDAAESAGEASDAEYSTAARGLASVNAVAFDKSFAADFLAGESEAAKQSA